MGRKLKIDDLAPILDRAALQIPPDTLDRLHAARRAALNQQRDASPSPLWVRVHHLVTEHGSASHPHRALNWVGVLLLVGVVLAGGWQWKQATWHDHAAIDLAILTDDLPLHMYVD